MTFTTTNNTAKGLLFLAVVLSGSWLSWAAENTYEPLHAPAALAAEEIEAPEDTSKDTTKRYRPSTRPKPNAQDRPGDPLSNKVPGSPLTPDAPPGTETKIVLDTITGNYIIYEKVGSLDYRPVSTMTFAEYEEYRRQKDFRSGLKAKAAGKEAETPLSSKSTIPRIYISPLFDRIFGGNYVDIRPNGSVLLDFGYRHQRVFNPAFPIRQQSNGQFLFDQQISLNATGKIGDKLKININQDTKAAFEFDNTIKLDYTGYDHEILQKIEAGNVSLPLSSSLIRGAQNLFGLKTTMQFGKMKVVSVVSNSRSNTNKIVLKNGAQSKDIMVRCNDYEDNRHYFTGHFFRNRFNSVLASPPNITSGTNVSSPPGSGLDNTGANTGLNTNTNTNTPNSSTSGTAGVPQSSANSGIQITRVELYVTNRANNTSTLRNIAAFQDLGEYNPFNPRWVTDPTSTPIAPLANSTNKEYAYLRALPNVLDVNQIGAILQNEGLQRSVDFEVVRGARKLTEDRDFTVQRQLGYLSLNTQLRDDEVLGVAMEYSYLGQVYKVGELTEDYTGRTEDQVIFLKLLRPSQVRLNLPTWNLQMKNIYSMGGGSISKDNFQLRIVYRDDSSGVDNPALPKGKTTKDVPLVQLLNLDRLDPTNELRPDGNFDYIEGITVDTRNGRIIFPITEPFGSFLRTKFDLNDPIDAALANKYVFQEMYSGTKSDALQAANKAKFFLVGRGQSSTATSINLGINVKDSSVSVFAGSQKLNRGVDYIMDESSGTLTILNAGVLNSGQDITIQFESPQFFTVTQKSFFGSRFDYAYSKKLNLGGTILYQNERPIVRRVAIGDEPARNTMIELDGNYKSESRFLTKMIDALPGIQTKAISTITAQGEYAHLFPAVNKYVDATGKGISFIDDFEATRTPIGSIQNPLRWRIASTPVGLEGTRAVGNDSAADLSHNDRRATVSWHITDPLFYNSASSLRPKSLSATDMANNYVRSVGPQEIEKGRDLNQINLNETIFDVVYYPQKRGPYNYNPALSPDGSLAGDGKPNWGGLMTDFSSQTDFDLANVQYLEFWMMNPFLNDDVGGNADGTQRTGQLRFDLGQISEDIVRDRRFSFENGQPVTGNKADYVDQTAVAKVPKAQILNTAFDNNPGSRPLQDIGLDGMNDEEERAFFANSFLNQLPSNLTPEARAAIEADPSNDGWKYYLGADQDAGSAKIPERYQRFNMPEGNSPIPGGSFAVSSYTNPDMEDINGDKSLNEVDAYYSYKVDMTPDRFKVGENYIVDQISGANGSSWYQFRIPIRELTHPNALPPTGGISDFKTIKFLRMFFTGFKQPVATRFFNLQMVASQWRVYPKRLASYGAGVVGPDASEFSVSTVNIEENGGASTNGQQKIPYTLPPGAQLRDKDITSGVSRRLNEQSIRMCVTSLSDGNAKAIFKNVNMDMLNYGRIQAYVHAETQDGSTKDRDMEIFVRVGTDFTDNFYEVAVPLSFTKYSSTGYSSDSIWKKSNFIDVPTASFWQAKLARNAAGASYYTPFISTIASDYGPQKVTVVGNPDLNAVLTVMIGVRNPVNDGYAKSACVWVDEFRVTNFILNDGWAATGIVNAKLADFATLQLSGKYSTPGWGGIDQKISERSRSTESVYSVSSNIALDKFIPFNATKVGMRIPMYVAYEHQQSTPKYDPLNPDVPLEQVPTEGKYNNYLNLVRDQTTRRSLNFTNVQKARVKQGAKPKIYDVENLSATFTYSETHRTNITIADFTQRTINYGAGYNYSSEPLTLQPFKKANFVNSPYLKLVKDLNFTPLPSSITVRADLLRNFTRQQLRSSDIFAPLNPSLLTYQKSLLFNRQFAVRWLPFRSLTVDYAATASAVVDEPKGEITGAKRDTVLKNIESFGRLKTFNQTFRFGYKVPFDKLPFTDWIQADLSYTAGLNWSASPLAQQDTLGNVLQNSRDRAINGRIDLLKLYNKVKYFQKINTPPPATPPKPPPPPQTPKQKADAKKAEQAEIARKKKETIRLENAIRLAKIKKAPGKIIDSLELMIKTLNKKIKEAKVKDTTAQHTDYLKPILRTLMSVRQINFQYQETQNTVLPGYRATPAYVGLSDKDGWAPGIPFILGSQDPEIRVRMAEANLLGKSKFQTQPFQQAQTITFTANTTIEPLRDFRLRLDVRRSQTANYNEIYRFNDTTFRGYNASRGGTFTTSFIALGSFRFNQASGDDANRHSQEWRAYKDNAFEVRDRLNFQNQHSFVNGDTLHYDTLSQDVIIPSFIAAYTGQSAKSVALSNFPKIPLPNWRIDYSGLSKIPALARTFSAITVSHSYTSNFSMDRYVSSLRYPGSRLTLNQSAEALPTLGNSVRQFVPVYNVGTVLISEKFAPLLGIDVRTKSKLTFKVAYNRDRAMSLNVSNAQITEVRTQDITIGAGFAKSGVTLPFIKDKGRPIVLKNELTMRADLTIRDNLTVQRRAGNATHVPTAGGLDIQFKPTANYVVNQRFNIQLYFERTISQPRVSTSFLRKVTAFGFQMRYALQ